MVKSEAKKVFVTVRDKIYEIIEKNAVVHPELTSRERIVSRKLFNRTLACVKQ
jgi:hypothetical protein